MFRDIARSAITYLLPATMSAMALADNVAPSNIFLADSQSNATAHSPIDFAVPDTAAMEEAMLRFRELAEQNNWPRLKPGPLLSFGDEHSQIPVARTMLRQLGYYDGSDDCGDSKLFDIELHEALINFQQQHGGKIDGILGPHSRRMLNISPQERADMLRLNIARIQSFGLPELPYIQVNIPEFKLRFFRTGTPPLEMKTIVGKRKRKTPIFQTEVNRVVVNPSWHVPRSIAYKDIIPVWKEDADYLEKMRLKVVQGWGKKQVTLDAAQVSPDELYKGDIPKRLWEPPNDRNTLGKVKFLTSGPYAVYLHDTSAKKLFEEPKRAFSSGCIRLEQPRKLADALLGYANATQSEKINNLFSQDATKTISLNHPVKLYTTYWTAWQDPQGRLHYRYDLYRRDLADLAELDQKIIPEPARPVPMLANQIDQ